MPAIVTNAGQEWFDRKVLEHRIATLEAEVERLRAEPILYGTISTPAGKPVTLYRLQSES